MNVPMYTTEDNFLRIRNDRDIPGIVYTEKYVYHKEYSFLGINIWRKEANNSVQQAEA